MSHPELILLIVPAIVLQRGCSCHTSPVGTTPGRVAEWREAPAPLSATPQESGPSTFATVIALVAVAAFAGWLIAWWFGAVLLVLFLTMLGLEKRGPARAQKVAGRVRKIQSRFGAGLRTGALWIVWVAFVLPVSLLRRGSINRPSQGWSMLGGSERFDPSRQFVAQSPQHGTRRPSRVARLVMGVGAVTLLLIADVVVGTLYGRLFDSDPAPDPRALLAAYDDSPWAEEYWATFSDASTWEYWPFVGWRRANFTGDFVNVSDGIRTTWQAPNLDADPLQIWMFGGSTTWGSGQRDDHTIASYLARLGDGSEVAVEVTNYGESGHRLWQEVLMLEAELIRGERPDVVIFYDGVNEPQRHGDVDTKTPTHSRAHIFEAKLESEVDVRRTVLTDYKKRSFAVRAARTARNAFRSQAPGQTEQRERPVPASVALPNMMGIYTEGVAISQDLAKRHGFEVVHFWQPNIYTKQAVAAEDEAWDVIGYATWDDDWYDKVYTGARGLLPDTVVDISDALDVTPKPTMIDPAHTNELGAQLVAEAIFAEIEPTLRSLDAKKGSGS